MAIIEVKTWLIICDRCRERKTVTDTLKPSKPAGWTVGEEGPCGLTDYFREVLLCPACSKKERLAKKANA